MSMGAADIQRRVSGELVVVQQQLDQPRLWSVAARLMTLYAKTFPGSDGAATVRWYRMAASAADESGDPAARVWVRGRAAIALGYEGASLGVADVLADQALAINARRSLGLLNAIYGKAHAAALRGDHATARALDTQGRGSSTRPARTSRPPTTRSRGGASTSSGPCSSPASATRRPRPRRRTRPWPNSPQLCLASPPTWSSTAA